MRLPAAAEHLPVSLGTHCCRTPQGYEDYMEVILARADCLRRQGPPAAERLRATFKAAAELLRSYFPDYVDRSYRWVAWLGLFWEIVSPAVR